MCGLVGWAVQGTLKVAEESKIQRAFSKLLMFDVVRGRDSTGVARVLGDGSVEIFKKAVPSYDFLETSFGTAAVSFKEAYINAMIGHNRAATVGKVNADNAHPFQHQHITLAHNGTLTYRGNLKNKCSTDSEEICKELAEVEDTVSVLEKLEGAYALTWYNAADDTINFARNDERPLWIANMVDNEGVIWASEQWMLIGAVSEPFKQPLRIADPWKLDTGKWFSIPLAGGKPHVKPFRPAEKSYSTVNYSANYGRRGGSSTTGNSTSSRQCIGAGTMKKIGVDSGVKVLVSISKKDIEQLGSRTVSSTIDVPIVSRASKYAKVKARLYSTQIQNLRQNLDAGIEIYSVKTSSDNWQYSDTITCTDLVPVCSAENFGSDKFPEELDGIKVAQEQSSVKKSKESNDGGSAQPTKDETTSASDSSLPVKLEDSDVPFEFYDHRGNIMDKDEFVTACKKDCPYCGDPLVESKSDEVVWLGTELAHLDCAADWEAYESRQSEQTDTGAIH